MRNKGMLVRTFFALSLILALGVAPGLGAYAQQAASQKQAAPRAEVAAEKSAKAAEEKGQQLSAEGDPLPLSDAEMEKVEGGFKFPSIMPHFDFHFTVNIKSHNNNHCK